MSQNLESPLLRAALAGDTENCRKLIERHGYAASINEPNHHGETVLFVAASMSTLDLAELLLAHGADVTHRSKMGVTPLRYANTPEMVRLLLAAGALVTTMDVDGNSELMRCTSNNQIDVAKVLIDAGIDVRIPNKTGWTALMRATNVMGATALVSLLINSGSQLDAQDSFGETALIKASRHACLENCRQLLEAGANPCIASKAGHTALHFCAQSDFAATRQAVAELLEVYSVQWQLNQASAPGAARKSRSRL